MSSRRSADEHPELSRSSLPSQNPAEMRKVQEEVDRVLGGRSPTMDDIKKLEYTRLVLAEGLRLYPQVRMDERRTDGVGGEQGKEGREGEEGRDGEKEGS